MVFEKNHRSLHDNMIAHAKYVEMKYEKTVKKIEVQKN